MIKGLKALERLAYESACCRCQYYKSNECFNKDECVWKTIEKKLKAFEIIKEKKVNVIILMGCDSVEEYNKHPLSWKKLTQEEYDLLKEVLL